MKKSRKELLSQSKEDVDEQLMLDQLEDDLSQVDADIQASQRRSRDLTRQLLAEKAREVLNPGECIRISSEIEASNAGVKGLIALRKEMFPDAHPLPKRK